MSGVEVSMNFENETAEFFLSRLDQTAGCFPGKRVGRNFNKSIEKFFNTEIIYGTPEKYRSQHPGEVIVYIEFIVDAVYKINLFTEPYCVMPDNSVYLRIIKPIKGFNLILILDLAFIGFEKMEFYLFG